jgi:uncharacterized membrane protein YdcZ (DUF606 family)
MVSKHKWYTYQSGFIGSVFITELEQNDGGVQNISGLNNYLLEMLAGIAIAGLFLCLYCDSMFSALATIFPCCQSNS